MIEIKNLLEIRAFQKDIDEMQKSLAVRVSLKDQEDMGVRITSIAAEIDRLIGDDGVVKNNVTRAMAKRKDKKASIKNGLVELNRNLLLIENIAVAKGVKPVFEQLDDIKYKLCEIKYNLAASKMFICLPLNLNRALEVVKDFLIESSKRVDSLIDRESRKLSKRVLYKVSKFDGEMQAVLEKENEVFEDGLIRAVEDDDEYVEFIFGEVLAIFKDIENVINEYMEQYPDDTIQSNN